VEASRAIGRGEIPAAMAVEGPEEIRELSRGFNQMSEGLQRLDAERRLMLAGISHDLRSPLVRLRLEVELSKPELDCNSARAMVRDIKEIDTILGQFLEFGRNESDEPPQQSEVNAIVVGGLRRLSAVRPRCQDGARAGRACKSAPRRRPAADHESRGQRGALRRKEIEVATSRNDDDHIVVTVADRGPGIQTGSPDAMIKPFAREDVSRSKPVRDSD